MQNNDDIARDGTAHQKRNSGDGETGFHAWDVEADPG
jgi:hypothetical protein